MCVYVYLNGQVVSVNIIRLALGTNTVRRHWIQKNTNCWKTHIYAILFRISTPLLRKCDSYLETTITIYPSLCTFLYLLLPLITHTCHPQKSHMTLPSWLSLQPLIINQSQRMTKFSCMTEFREIQWLRYKAQKNKTKENKKTFPNLNRIAVTLNLFLFNAFHLFQPLVLYLQVSSQLIESH